VVPEVDTPGHIYSWGFGHPNVVTACPQTLARLGIYNAVLDPSEEETFTVISALLTELNAIFPDPFFHLGGDEVYFTCWRESQKVTDFMQKMGFGQNYSLLQQYYQNRLLNISATVRGSGGTGEEF
jgi:hexosaminidase